MSERSHYEKPACHWPPLWAFLVSGFMWVMIVAGFATLFSELWG